MRQHLLLTHYREDSDPRPHQNFQLICYLKIIKQHLLVANKFSDRLRSGVLWW